MAGYNHSETYFSPEDAGTKIPENTQRTRMPQLQHKAKKHVVE